MPSVSKPRIGCRPLRPASSAAQNVAASLPIGDSAPQPVTQARRWVALTLAATSPRRMGGMRHLRLVLSAQSQRAIGHAGAAFERPAIAARAEKFLHAVAHDLATSTNTGGALVQTWVGKAAYAGQAAAGLRVVRSQSAAITAAAVVREQLAVRAVAAGSTLVRDTGTTFRGPVEIGIARAVLGTAVGCADLLAATFSGRSADPAAGIAANVTMLA